MYLTDLVCELPDSRKQIIYIFLVLLKISAIAVKKIKSPKKCEVILVLIPGTEKQECI